MTENAKKTRKRRERESYRNRRGSILIWTIALGVMLTSVFFFFGSRLRGNALSQQSLMRWQSQKAYAESYAGYLKSLNPMTLNSLASADFDDIKGTVSKETGAIEGFLDNGQSSPVYSIAEPVTIEWNRCDLAQEGDLLINNTEGPQYHVVAADCAGYDDIVTFNPATPIHMNKVALTALSGPMHYRISTVSGNRLNDTKYHLNLSIPLQFRKTFEVNETFTP
ncbi:MAG: hypothetical protein V1760_01155 [Candidatus Peregrinibacteria bacterium]